MKNSLISLALFTAANVNFAGTMGPVQENSAFDGFYAGLGTGMLTLYSKDTYSVSVPGVGVVRSGSNSVTNSATLFSGQFGYGRMFSSNTYLGAKASIYYTPLNDADSRGYTTARGTGVLVTGEDTIHRLVKPIYNIDAVLGYAYSPKLLPFVEAGVSFGNVKHGFTFTGAVSDLTNDVVTAYVGTTTIDKYKADFNVGIGANYLVHPKLMLSSELVYTNFSNRNLSSVTFTSPGSTATHDRQENNNAVSLLVNASYMF